MPHRLMQIIFMLLLAVVAQLAGAAKAQSPPPARYAAPGTASTGEILREDGGELHLNVEPCAAKRVVVIFRTPYSKDSAGTIQCGAVTKTLVQAIQK